MTKGVTIARVLQRFVVGALGHTQGASGNVDATGFQGAQDLLHSAAFNPTNEVFLRHAHINQGHFTGLGALVSELGQVLADGKARGAGFNQDQAHALVGWASRRVSLDQDGQRVGVASVGDPGLGAVDDVVIAIELGGGLDALQVRAGLGLGQANATATLTGGQVGQVLLLLLFGAVHGDDLASQ